jgi:putative hydrolase of the HAD superfamily
MTPPRAVLFDVGGPLDLEVEHERAIDADLRAALVAAGRTVTDADFDAAARAAVDSFASNAYLAILYRLLDRDRARTEAALRFVAGRSAARDLFEPRPGMVELLAELHARGLRLGLAANQPAAAVARLDRHGLGRYFHHREVSEIHGFRKPDVRLFLRACDDLGVLPAETVMVGDRIDNDIAPARLLGMTAILFRTGRHRDQQPRTPDEEPHVTVESVDQLRLALDRLLSG